MKALHFADLNPKMTVLITAPSLRQSMIMFDRIVSFVYASPRLRSKLARVTHTLVNSTTAAESSPYPAANIASEATAPT